MGRAASIVGIPLPLPGAARGRGNDMNDYHPTLYARNNALHECILESGMTRILNGIRNFSIINGESV